MANLERIVGNPIFIGSPLSVGGSRIGLALDAAFVNGTSGDCVAIRYEALVASTIDELYIFLDDYAGTLGNISIAVKIYNEGSNRLRAGSTELWPAAGGGAATTTMPAAADKWIKVALSVPYTTTVGQILWICMSNGAAAPATDYPNILYTTNMSNLLNQQVGYCSILAMYTSSGFSSDGGQAPEMPFVIKHGTIYVGQPWTRHSGTYYTNNQLERGIQFTTTEDVTVGTVEINTGSTAYSDARLLADATAPGGSALYTWDLDSDAGETYADAYGAKTFDTAITLTGGTTYKLTLTYSTNSQLPWVLEIEDYSTYSTVFDTLRGYDTYRHPWGVIDNGSGGWTTDKAICPCLGMKISDFPLQSSGGGGVTATIGSPFAG